MTKKFRIIIGIIVLIILGVFNAVYWSIPYLLHFNDHLAPGYYVSYGFITFAMLLTAGTIFYATKQDRDGFLYPLPLIYLALSYTLVELAVGNPLGLISKVPLLWALLPQIVITGAYIVLILLAFAGILFQRSVRDRALKKVSYIRDVKQIADQASYNCNEPSVKKELDKLSENIRYADPMSDDSLASIELEIRDLCLSLKEKIENKDNESALELIKKINYLLIERNTKCRNLK